ncbi:hypothetical protein KPaMU14_06590 [Kocuria palustris]|nr:hypothetical protein KPaMU14_06590 [Kocuria palustris]
MSDIRQLSHSLGGLRLDMGRRLPGVDNSQLDYLTEISLKENSIRGFKKSLELITDKTSPQVTAALKIDAPPRMMEDLGHPDRAFETLIRQR